MRAINPVCIGAQKFESAANAMAFSIGPSLPYLAFLDWVLGEGTALKDQDSAGRLTTHVLDVSSGKPAAGMKVELFSVDGSAFELILTARTNSDGRCDAPLLSGADLKRGEYELRFHAGAYLDASSKSSGRRFLDIIPIRFGIEDAGAHYHVPLLVAPYGYSTYRGS
jgi:5-hydroxyisourate hydrolase